MLHLQICDGPLTSIQEMSSDYCSITCEITQSRLTDNNKKSTTDGSQIEVERDWNKKTENGCKKRLTYIK